MLRVPKRDFKDGFVCRTDESGSLVKIANISSVDDSGLGTFRYCFLSDDGKTEYLSAHYSSYYEHDKEIVLEAFIPE